MDVTKLRDAVAIPEAARGDVHLFGELDATATGMPRVILRIADQFDRVHFDGGLHCDRT
ncbi:hypothetical protein QA640_37735 [Bradyrhizobium sp. CB82]|uniref:hypothetical protein n=1 Tax=Bradyrhizobium sp. CB82 TaxID=3039159 RepID=UPI0024B1B0A9|nr:hypothetical protein [Bradyrhizobium sp. CB82]WFU39963.1 hypothetical protein QA640_37735 [Bradyrhizobium sp. CB82]